MKRNMHFSGKIAVLLKLIVLFVCIFDVINYAESYTAIPDICSTPDDDIGQCIPMTECKTMLDFLKNYRKPYPKALEKKLKEFSCDDRDASLVCCSSTEIHVDIPPSPPDITDHKNLHLLPEDCGLIDIGDKIRNGVDALLNEFPWMALLQYNTSDGLQFKCGGAIINERYILTAAHCLAGTLSPLVGVRIGEYDLASEPDCQGELCHPPVKDLPIEKVIYHKGFNETSLNENDIGLVRVPQINLEEYRPVCLPILPEVRDQEFTFCTVTGWGFTEANRTTSTGVLQKVELPVQELDNCRRAYRGIRGIKLSYKQWCIGGTDKKDTCQGDSGGPLHVATYFNDDDRYAELGVVSFGHAYCGATGYPGIYTKVPYYMDWILDNIDP